MTVHAQTVIKLSVVCVRSKDSSSVAATVLPLCVMKAADSTRRFVKKTVACARDVWRSEYVPGVSLRFVSSASTLWILWMNVLCVSAIRATASSSIVRSLLRIVLNAKGHFAKSINVSLIVQRVRPAIVMTVLAFTRHATRLVMWDALVKKARDRQRRPNCNEFTR